MKATSAILAAVSLAALTTPAQAANLLVNSSFESGLLNPWIASNGNPFLTTAEAHTGQVSVAAQGPESIRQTFAAVATSQITEVSVWVKRLGGAFSAYAFFYDDSTSSTGLLSGSGDGWSIFDLTSNLAANKNLTGFEIYGTSPGPAYLDDFTINANVTTAGAVPEPATWAMMLLGFGAMGFAMRRGSAPKVQLRYDFV